MSFTKPSPTRYKNRLLGHERFVDGNTAVEETMQATPKLEEEFPTARMLSSEVSLGVDQTEKPESKHEIKALEIQEGESEEKLDKELRSKRWSNFVKIIVGILLLGFVLCIIVDTTTNGYIKDGIELFFEWIEVHPIIGFFSFVVGMC
jgi:hypothetical protein